MASMWLSGWLATAAVVLLGARGHVLRCCPPHHRLNQRLECEAGPAPPLPGIPPAAPRRRPCTLPWADFRTWDPGKLDLLSDGSLRLPEGVLFPPETFCVEMLVTIPVVMLCPCFFAACARKCCPGEEFLNTTAPSCDVQNGEELLDWKPTFSTAVQQSYVLSSLEDRSPECNGFFLNAKPEKHEIDYVIDSDGSLRLKDSSRTYSKEQFCGDITISETGGVSEVLFLCLLPPAERDWYLDLYASFNILGSLFLLLTLVIYLSLPELRKTVHSKNLIAHIATMFIGHVIGTYTSFNFYRSKLLCQLFTFGHQFCFLSAFFWLNVMCIDIAWTFSKYRAPEMNGLIESEKRKFGCYSLYVWLSTTIIVVITIVFDFLPQEITGSVAPNISTKKCWFEGRISMFLFFYLPISFLLMLNMILFIFTSLKIMQARRNTAILIRNDSFRHDGSQIDHSHERRFMLYFKLFLLMGITWIFEVISWSIPDHESYFIFFITDGINSLRGLFIFCLFCCKKKIFDLIKLKFYFTRTLRGKRNKKRPNLHRIPTNSSTLQYVNSVYSGSRKNSATD